MTRRVRFTPRACTRAFAVAGLVAGLLAGGRAGAADVPFAPVAVISNLESGPAALAPADMDGDGDVDLLAGSSRIAWFDNANGDGSLWTLRTITTNPAGSRSVSAADVDRDGDLDVVATSGSNAVVWHENTAGNGSAWVAHTISTAVETPWTSVVADLDHDGDTDVVSGNTVLATGSIYFHENIAGDGSLWTLRTIFNGTSFVSAVAAADMDGDGDLDALASSLNDTSLAWHENLTGNGTSWARRTISSAAQAQDLVSADVDHDGDQDVVVSLYANDTVAWFENVAGNGTAWTLRTIATAMDGVFGLAAADLDRDGDVDVVSVPAQSDAVVWHENLDGHAGTWTTHTVGARGDLPLDAVVADFDGDGDPDIASVAQLANEIAWFRNDSIHQTACFARQPDISTGPGDNTIFTAMATADVDGDGDQDALSVQADSRLSWHENALGNGSSWIDHTVATSTGRLYSIVPVDTNGDGDIDLISHPVFVMTRFDNTVGNGTVWSPNVVSMFSFSRGSLAAMDLDRDGDQDLLVPDAPSSQLGWFENPGLSGSWVPHTIATPPRFWAAGADVDGDGDQDVMSTEYGGAFTWYENVGGGAASWTPHPVPAISNVFAGPGPIDIDGDGDPDLLTTTGLGLLRWLENGANGSVWTIRTVATSAFPTSWVDAGDLDGDGDVDGVAFDFGVGLVWYESTANGTVWLRHTAAIQSSDAIAVARAADLDSDGDLDLLHGRPHQSTVGWSRNEGGQVVLDLADQVPSGVNNNDVFPVFRLTVTHGGRAGDSDLELARIGLLFEEGPGDPLSTAEANGLVEELRVYRDANRHGTFDPGIDTLVATVPTLALTAGVQTITLVDGDPNVQVAFGTPRTFFVVAQIAATASQQAPNQFRVTHLATGPSATLAEDRSADLPLTIACAGDLASRVIGPVVPVELTGFTIE